MSIELKIKSKHLALEPAIIKHEEYKLLSQLVWYKQRHQITDIYRDEGANELHRKWWKLTTHRRRDVRNEARATFLARAYLAGKSYKSVEAKTNDFPLLMTVIYPRIVDMIAKYGPNKIYKYHTPDKGMAYRPAQIAPIMDAITQWISKE